MRISVDVLVFFLSVLCLAVPLFWVFYRYKKGQTLSPVEPIWILILYILLGINLKVFYVQFIRPDDAVAIFYQKSDRILQNGGLEILLPGLFGLLLGIIFFIIGQAVNKKSIPLPSAFKFYSLEKRRLDIVVIVLTVISIVCFALFAGNELFFSDPADSTGKRFNQIEGGSVNRIFTAKYYLYKFSTISRYAFYALLFYIIVNTKSPNRDILILYVIFAINISISAYFGNRAHTLVMLFDMCAVLLLNISRRNMKLLAIFFILSFGVILSTTIIRQMNFASNETYVKSKNNEAYKVSEIVEKNKNLNSDQIDKLVLYDRCRQRVNFHNNNINGIDNQHAYWGKRSYELAPKGTGQQSFPVELINSIYPPLKNRDICSGGIDVVKNPDEATPYGPLMHKIVGTAERFLQGRYFTDVAKTSHIIRKVPSEMGYLNGQSLIGWVFTPIPTSVWPDKPLFIQVPPILSSVIFQEPYNNVPPGIIAELFLNYGWLGIIVGMFIVGYILRLLFNTAVGNPNLVAIQIIYAMLMVRMTVILFNTSLGTAILKSIIDIVPLLIVFWFVRKQKTQAVEATTSR